MEAKAYKITKVNAVDSGIHVTFPLNHMVTQGDNNAAYVRDAEFAQKIAAALNFFDLIMDSIGKVSGANDSSAKHETEPDKFSEYITGGSWIGKIGYDCNKNKLRVWKVSDKPVDGPYGDYFTHLNVPVEVWSQLISANSVGGEYNRIVRGKYPLEEK